MAETKKVAVPSIDSVETSAQYDSYTGVRIIVGTNDNGDQQVYEAGDVTGRVLEVTNPFGTQEMANNIWNDLNTSGFKYQPLKVSGAVLNPAAEIGDGISANGIYSGIFKRYTTFGRLMKSDVEAPSEEEIDHEYAYETSSNREYSRFVASTKASLKINSDNISAEIENRKTADNSLSSSFKIRADTIEANAVKTVGGNNSSFGWSLTANGFILASGGSTVFRANSSGIEITGSGTFSGTIKASDGKIGGFTIGTNAIHTDGISTYSDSTQNSGVYIGTDGINLGGGKFKVDSSGNLTASSGTFKGTVWAKNIKVGDEEGHIERSQLSEANQTGVDGGTNFNSMAVSNSYTPKFMKATYLNGANWMVTNVDGTTSTRTISWKSVAVPSAVGATISTVLSADGVSTTKYAVRTGYNANNTEYKMAYLVKETGCTISMTSYQKHYLGINTAF